MRCVEGGKVGRAIACFSKYRRDIRVRGKRMCKEFDVHVRETLHAEDPGALWSYDAYVRKLSYGQQRGAQPSHSLSSDVQSVRLSRSSCMMSVESL